MQIMEREQTFETYLDLLRELSGVLEQLTEVNQKKAAAVRADDLNLLNTCIKQEQAVSMALRGLEKRRTAALEALGLAEIPLSGLAKHCPEPLAGQARAVSERLRDSYMLYRSASEVARTTLECNLHQIEKILYDTRGAAPSPSEPPAPMKADIRA